jgi:hypothetical protein
MNTMKLTPWLLACVLTGCASAPSPAELNQQALTAIKSSFRDQGIAKVDRLDQDLGQQACSSASPPSPEVAKRIEEQALASIRWPAGGLYIGDWREGEKLAKRSRHDLTDASAAPKTMAEAPQLPPDREEGDLVRHHRPSLEYGRRAAQRCRRSASLPVAIHLGQAVEQQGLRGVLEHAALRPYGSADENLRNSRRCC